jgi:hypothetical protein
MLSYDDFSEIHDQIVTKANKLWFDMSVRLSIIYSIYNDSFGHDMTY